MTLVPLHDRTRSRSALRWCVGQRKGLRRRRIQRGFASDRGGHHRFEVVRFFQLKPETQAVTAASYRRHKKLAEAGSLRYENRQHLRLKKSFTASNDRLVRQANPTVRFGNLVGEPSRLQHDCH